MEFIRRRFLHSWPYRLIHRRRISNEMKVAPAYYDLLVRMSASKRRHAHSKTFENWIDYGLSANVRAAWLFDFLKAEMDLSGKSVLDVGCGFGGHSIIAVRRGARRALAVDVDDYYLRLAASNAQSLGFAPGGRPTT